MAKNLPLKNPFSISNFKSKDPVVGRLHKRFSAPFTFTSALDVYNARQFEHVQSIHPVVVVEEVPDDLYFEALQTKAGGFDLNICSAASRCLRCQAAFESDERLGLTLDDYGNPKFPVLKTLCELLKKT